MASAEENLGGTVPQSDDLMGVCANWDAEGAGKTEVGELHGSRLVDEKVLRLEVTVEDTV